jgi:hypothetical protein
MSPSTSRAAAESQPYLLSNDLLSFYPASDLPIWPTFGRKL